MLDQDWFSEAAGGYAMSLQIRARLHEVRSRYQHIAVYDTVSFGQMMALDGITMLCTRDHFIYHEMLTHPALFAHPCPQQVLIVGGGDCGSLCEVLRHPGLRQVTQVELDEEVTRVCERFFPELCASNQDPRVHLLFQDAVSWLSAAEAASQDIIVLDTTDPVGQAARLFAAPFYRSCHRTLRDEGILVTQSESPLLDLAILQGIRSQLRAAGFRHLETIYFPLPSYPSGWWSATLATKSRPFSALTGRLTEQQTVASRYYNSDIHRSCTATPEFLKGCLP